MKYPTDISFCHELLKKQNNQIVGQSKQLTKQNQEILHLHKLLLELSEEMAKLKNQLSKNSTNSHRPSSTDYFFRKTVAIEPSDKAKGGQKGHIGNTLRMVENPDQIIIHEPTRCSCGENLAAFSVLLNNNCQVSFRKIGMIFESIVGQSINQTTLQNANNEAHLALESVEKSNIEDLKSSQVVRADETVLKVKGSFNYIHTVADGKTTHLWASTYRGSNAHTVEESPLMGFKNTVMHDRLPLHNQFDEATHLCCNAHLMRKLQSLCEQNYTWAIRLLRVHRQLYRMCKKVKAMDSRFKVKIDNWFDKIIAEDLTQEPAPKLNIINGKPSKTESKNLLEFFQKHRTEVLAFAFDKAMPFSNNLAEQAFRHVKTRMKVIGGFRLIEGAKNYARCQAVMDTWRKRGQSAYENLKIALNVWQISPKYA